MFSTQIFQENTFLKTKPNFPLVGKCFPLTNFSNGKQTQESLESDSRKPLSGKQTQSKGKTLSWSNYTGKCFPLTGKCFPLTGKCFSLTGKYFLLPTFLIANKYRKVWKVISRKLLSRKQTWPKRVKYSRRVTFYE